MNGGRNRFIALVAVMLCLCLAACMPPAQERTRGYTVVDGAGRTVTLPHVPQRIIANTANLEDLAIGLAGSGRMAAVSDAAVREDSLCRDAAREVKARWEGRLTPEFIIAQQPDLIIVQDSDEHLIHLEDELRIPVVVLPVATNREMILERIRIVAAALHEEARGEEMRVHIEEGAARIAARLADVAAENRPIALMYSVQGAFGSPEGLAHHVLTDAGLRNGAAIVGLKKGDHLSKEGVVRAHPDYLILPEVASVSRGDQSADELAAAVASDPAYAELPAVQRGHILRIPDAYRYCSSHHYIDGVVLLHEAVYGPLP